MIKPIVQMIWSADVDDMEAQTPADPASFCILVQALIGVAGEDGADTFNFLVCTPDRLAARVPPGGALPGRMYIFVERYDYQRIRAAIQDLCDRAAARDWQHAAAILARYGRWEYEDELSTGE